MTLLDALLDELAADPAALARLRGLVAAGEPQQPELLSVTSAARILDVSPRTVRRRIADGSLPAVSEHGRAMVRADELHAYIDGLERPSRPRAQRRARRPRRHDYSFLGE